MIVEGCDLAFGFIFVYAVLVTVYCRPFDEFKYI